MSARDFLPPRLTLPAMRRAAASCQGCELYKAATQTVFGDGPNNARLMFVGEMPGDREDQEGKPFVGPAGQLLLDAMENAGIPRDTTYITNAVKHFHWEARGKRRIHKKPSSRQIEACKPWLLAEIEVVAPALIVCLGATAAQTLLGKAFRITRQRGEFLREGELPWAMATYHPSAILRAPESEDAERMRREFRGDLASAAKKLQLLVSGTAP